MQRYRLFLLALLTAFVVGCGGGSSSDTTSASGDDVEGLSTPNRVSIVDADS